MATGWLSFCLNMNNCRMFSFCSNLTCFSIHRRDDPPNGSCLIARNDADSSCEFNFIADNIFGAVL